MKRLNRLVVFGFSLAAAVCIGVVARPKTALAGEIKSDNMAPAIVEGNNSFAVGLYGQLARLNPEGNLFFSPYSVYSVLLMAAEGARGETLAQMAGVLHLPDSIRTRPDREADAWQIHAGLAALNKRLTAANRVPDSLRGKIADLEGRLAAANKEVSRLGRGSNFDAIEKAGQNARRIAADLNVLLPQADQYELRVANSLWGEKTYPFHPAYLAVIRKNYGEQSIFAVDFLERAEAARQQINNWAAAETNNHVRDIVPTGSVNAETRLVLANAVYFKGAWSQPFDARQTADGKFNLSDGDAANVPLMHRDALGVGQYGAFNEDGSFFATPTMVPADGAEASKSESPRYPEKGGFTALSLPYKGGALSMVFLVPQSADGLPRIESQLAGAALPLWVGQLRGRDVHVFIPRFKLETEYPLNLPLEALGMTRAFAPNLAGDGAQFDGMCESADPVHRFFISQVLHKAFVETNEKGAEAAAATSVLFPPKESRAEQPKMVPFTPTFRADKPFIFLIRDQQSGAILFLGRITNPNP